MKSTRSNNDHTDHSRSSSQGIVVQPSGDDTTGGTSRNNTYLQDKAKAIALLLDEPIIDLWALRAYAISDGGLVNDVLRRRAWPKLVGLHERIWYVDHPTQSRETSIPESLVVTPKRSNVVVQNDGTAEDGDGGGSRDTAVVTDSTTLSSTTAAEATTELSCETNDDGNVTLRRSRRIQDSSQTKKVQDIFRSEVQNQHCKTHRLVVPNNDSTTTTNESDTMTYGDECGSVSSSTSSFSSSAASLQQQRRRGFGTRRNSAAFHDKILASSLDCTQIELDVLRCTWHLLTSTQKRSQHQLGKSNIELQMEQKKQYKKVMKIIQRKQRRLSNLINLTLIQSYQKIQYHHDVIVTNSHWNNNNKNSTLIATKDHTLRYYQGYHDVACIILSTIGISKPLSRLVPPPQQPIYLEEDTDQTKDYLMNHGGGSSSGNISAMTITGFEMTTAILLQLSQSHLRDCMRPNFAQLQVVMRITIFPLLSYFDRPVHEFLMSCDMMEPYFALSWIITWFSHDIRDTELVKRLFDFFMVSHPLMPIYVAIAMICHPFNRQDVLQSECDFSIVHQTLSSLPRNSSMVGWKYRPVDGQYVSDDENDGENSDDDDDDDDLLSIGPMGSQSSVDTEFLLHEAATLKQSNKGGKNGTTTTSADCYVADAEAVSIVSSSMSSMYTARVPFQELIDIALQFIERVPPKNLMRLATRYYGREFIENEMNVPTTDTNCSASTNTTPSGHNKFIDITFLQPPPAWTRSFTAHSDQTLKYYRNAKHRTTASTLERPAAQDCSTVPSIDTLSSKYECQESELLPKLFLEEKNKMLAVIAAGYGHGDDADRRRRKQRKRIMAGTALAVMVVAIVAGIVLQQNRSKQQAPRSAINATTNSSSDTSCSNIIPDPLSSSSATKVIATSTRVTTSSSPMTVHTGSRTSSNMSKDIPECKVRRNPFERKCSASNVAPQHPPPLHSPFAIPLGDDKSSVVAIDSKHGGARNTSADQIVQNVNDLDIVISTTVKKLVRTAQMFRNQIRHVSRAMIVTSWNDCAMKSQRWVGMVRNAWTANLQHLRVYGNDIVKGPLETIPHRFVGVCQDGFRFGTGRVKLGINKMQQSLSTKTSRVVSEAKSALSLAESIAFDDGTLAARPKTVETRSIVVALEKEFQPPDIKDVSEYLVSLVQEFIHSPIHHTILEWKALLDNRFARFESFRDEQVANMIAFMTAYRTQLIKIVEFNEQNISMLVDFLRVYQAHIVSVLARWKAEQGTTLRFMSQSETVTTARIKVTNAIQSPALRNAIRGASFVDQYPFQRKNVDAPKVEHPDSDIQLITSKSISDDLIHEVPRVEQCPSKLSLNFDELTIFDCSAKPSLV